MLNGNRVYIQSLVVLNKIDLVNQGFVEVQTKIGDKFIPISADSNINIDALKEAIYNELHFIRIYMRPKGGETDYREPMIIHRDCQSKTCVIKFTVICGSFSLHMSGEEVQSLMVRKLDQNTCYWMRMY